MSAPFFRRGGKRRNRARKNAVRKNAPVCAAQADRCCRFCTIPSPPEAIMAVTSDNVARAFPFALSPPRGTENATATAHSRTLQIFAGLTGSLNASVPKTAGITKPKE